MRQFEGTLPSEDGLILYYQSWFPLTSVKAVLGIVHGLGSHSGQFSQLAQGLVSGGYGVYGIDLRGHGRSPGQRGYINTWAEFRGDLASLWHLMQRQHPTLPTFLMGHSLGALIILDYVLATAPPLAGAIVLAPALQPAGVPPLRLALGQLLSRIWPRFSLNTGISQNAGSHDPDCIATTLRDPFRHTKGTARLATEFLQTTRSVQANLKRWQSPLLILHGSDDGVTLPESSRQLFAQMQIEDKAYREYAGACHDLHHDISTPLVVTDLMDWLDRHLDQSVVRESACECQPDLS